MSLQQVGGEGSDDETKGDTACIKLISNKNNEDSPKNVIKQNIKGKHKTITINLYVLLY